MKKSITFIWFVKTLSFFFVFDFNKARLTSSLSLFLLKYFHNCEPCVIQRKDWMRLAFWLPEAYSVSFSFSLLFHSKLAYCTGYIRSKVWLIKRPCGQRRINDEFSLFLLLFTFSWWNNGKFFFLFSCFIHANNR